MAVLPMEITRRAWAETVAMRLVQVARQEAAQQAVQAVRVAPVVWRQAVQAAMAEAVAVLQVAPVAQAAAHLADPEDSQAVHPAVPAVALAV